MLSHCRRKSLRKSSSIRNKVWYFRCPNCLKETMVVTHRMYAECGGRWCRGLVNLRQHQITETEYRKAWGYD